MNELYVQYLVTLCRLRGKKSDTEQGSAVSCSDYCLRSGLIIQLRIPKFSNRANLVIAVCLTFRDHPLNFAWKIILPETLASERLYQYYNSKWVYLDSQ